MDYLKYDYYSSLLLIAKTQSKGRGRKQNDWYSPEGGFWATLGASTSSLSKSQLALFHFFTATLIRFVIENEYNLKTQIKWPNDILYENKKLAGILIDYIVSSQVNYILIGIGVNLNNSSKKMPEGLSSKSVSIKDVLKKPVSIDKFAKKICFYANKYYSPITENNLMVIKTLIQEYNEHSQIFGKEVILDDSKKYLCQGINHKGYMRFEQKNMKRNLTIDDVTRIRTIIHRRT